VDVEYSTTENACARQASESILHESDSARVTAMHFQDLQERMNKGNEDQARRSSSSVQKLWGIA